MKIQKFKNETCWLDLIVITPKKCKNQYEWFSKSEKDVSFVDSASEVEKITDKGVVEKTMNFSIKSWPIFEEIFWWIYLPDFWWNFEAIFYEKKWCVRLFEIEALYDEYLDVFLHSNFVSSPSTMPM